MIAVSFFLVLCVFSVDSMLKIVSKGVIPSNFSCEGRISGYYADVETGCQTYHFCDGLNHQYSYVCPNSTLFQQRMMVCFHAYMVDCKDSEKDYDANLLIGRKGEPFVSDLDQSNFGKRLDQLKVEEDFGKSKAGSNFDQRKISTHFDQPKIGTNFGQQKLTTNFEQAKTSESFYPSTISPRFDQPKISTNFGQPKISTNFDQAKINTNFYPSTISPLFDQPKIGTNFGQQKMSTNFDQTKIGTDFDQPNINQIVPTFDQTAFDHSKIIKNLDESNLIKTTDPTIFKPSIDQNFQQRQSKSSKNQDSVIRLILNDTRNLFFISNQNSSTGEDLKTVQEFFIPVENQTTNFRFKKNPTVGNGCPGYCHPKFLIPGTCHPCLMIK